MSALKVSLIAAAAAVSTVFGYFCSSKSTNDDKQSSDSSAPSSGSASRTKPSHLSPPPASSPRSQTTTRIPSSSTDRAHDLYSYYLSAHPTTTLGTASASASASAQPSYQPPPVHPHVVQARAQTKEILESSDHIRRQNLASSRQTPSASTSAQSPYQPPPIHPRSAQTRANTEENLEPSRYNLTSSRQTPPTSVTHSHASSPAQPTTSPISKVTSTTSVYPDPLELHRAGLSSPHARESRKPPPTSDYLDRLERHRASLSSYTRESRQTLPTSPPDTQSTPSCVGKTTPITGDYPDHVRRARLASTAWESLPTPSTSARASQTTVWTPAVADYEGDIGRSGLTSLGANESRVVYPTSPLSSYSHQRAPSPDAAPVRISRLTVSPQKHSRTQSSSSDSDYLSPSSRTRAAWSPPSPDVLQDPESDDPVANAENQKKANELRKKARRSNREMRDARDRVKDARRRGDHVAESEYSQEARAHESAMKNSDKIAAKLIFKIKNQRQEEGTVDLHGLYVKEAVDYAKKGLESAMYRDDDTVSFIVGKGLHAENGVSKLRPALEELFDERGLRYSLDPENSGILIVYL